MEGLNKNPKEPRTEIENLEDIRRKIKVFGNLLYEYRSQKIAKTRKEIKNSLGVSNSTIFGWENDEKLPNVEMLPKIAEIYAINLIELQKAWQISQDAKKQVIYELKALRKKPPRRKKNSDDEPFGLNPGSNYPRKKQY